MPAVKVGKGHAEGGGSLSSCKDRVAKALHRAKNKQIKHIVIVIIVVGVIAIIIIIISILITITFFDIVKT